MRKFLAVPILCLVLGLPAFGQTGYAGSGWYSGSATLGSPVGAPAFYAALPINWVDNTVCNPPGGVYDTTVVLGTTNNIGPNNTGGPVGSPYALTPSGLEDAMNNWRDNADNASQTPHFADKWWLIQVPAQSTGTVLHGSTFDGNNALVSLPGKVNGGVTEPTKCLVIDSTTPLTAGVMACGRGLPGFGGARNPGCSSPNDKASMWKVQLDGPLTAAGRNGIYAGGDLATPTNWANHVVLRDVEITMAPGADQSASNVHAPYLFRAIPNITNAAPCSVATPCIVATHLGLDRYYVHGWDPGDPGQPSGACSVWTNSGTLTVAPDGGGVNSTVTYVSGSYFGMTFTPGSTINIGGTNYTIANTALTQGVLTGLSNTTLSIIGTVTMGTATAYTQSNPPAQYANGCGDDVVWGVLFDCDSCWRENGYIEKIHWWGSESHASQQGFSNGPYKDVNNWEEGGSATWFNGGAPVDTQGGPTADQEVRRNYFGRDLNYRQLTGSAGSSPAPPWGCGSADSHASHNTCPFSWAVKNSVELKLGHRVLLDGNVIENSWADGQTGWCIVVGPRSCSGGSACGIFDPTTGLPKTAIDNIRFSNNWVRNCPEPFTSGSRSGKIGDGGGLSLPSQNNDYINNLMTNVNDTNQTGNPNDQWVWGLGSINYPCAMTYAGSGPYIVTASCSPYQQDITAKISEISSTLTSGNSIVSIAYGPGSFGNGERMDPMLATSATGTCIANGNSWTTCPVVIANHPGWNGSFAMTATSGNWASDGTGGNGITYTDSTNNPGTAVLCSNSGSPTCTALLNSGDVTYASLGFKMTDVSVGDAVYMANVGNGDTTCTANDYAVSAFGSGITYAISGTVPTGLTVVYQVTTQPSASSANCILNNGAGFPKFITFQNNTVLSPNVFALQADNGWQYSIGNQMFNNVFADNDSGLDSDLNCTAAAKEGTSSFGCWDSNTFEFYQNVMTSRNSTNWSVMNCPGGSCVNAFPLSVNCSGAAADPTCLGYAGFLGSSPTVTYPSGACIYDGSNPFNCVLMALPWANNFVYTDVSYAASSSYPTQGVNTIQLGTAMTQTKYVCPVGANCGTHGPYPD